jgi:hypothetical protein
MTLAFAPKRIEHWPLARLHPYAKNAKLDGPDQVAKIAASMAAFGWTVPCLVGDDGELIASVSLWRSSRRRKLRVVASSGMRSSPDSIPPNGRIVSLS